MRREGRELDLEADSVELQSLTGAHTHTSSGNKANDAGPSELGDHDKDILSFQGYYAPLWKQFVYYLLAIPTFGLSYLAAQWFLRVRVALSLSPCPLPDAEWVVVTLTDSREDLTPVHRIPAFTSINIQTNNTTTNNSFPATTIHVNAGSDSQPPMVKGSGGGYDRFLEYHCGRYLFSYTSGTFHPIPATPRNFVDELNAAASGARRLKGPLADEWERADRRALYGPNELKVAVKSPLQLLGAEMVHPFYVFQYASVTIWCLEEYYSYSLIIIAITFFSILTTVVQAYRYRRRLAKLAHFTCEMQVLQPGRSVTTLDSTELVPGDVVVLHPGLLPCDIVLLRGEAIVDETMLTGETVPVRKVAYVPEGDKSYDADVCKSCTLYGGTSVAQVRPGGAERMALGVVARTAFWTAKGQLMKSILFPRNHKQTFANDSMAFIAVMLCFGLLFYIWDVVALVAYGAPTGFIILRYLDLITVAVPPALPACLTVATAIAVSRLAEHGVFVSNPAAITLAGHLDVICFDKTGTLTEPGLDLLGVVPVADACSSNSTSKKSIIATTSTTAIEELEKEALHQSSQQQPPKQQQRTCGDLIHPNNNSNNNNNNICAALPAIFQEILATCHGLAQLDGDLVGDPLDQKLFECTQWRMLDEGVAAPIEIVTIVTDEGNFEDTFSSSSTPLSSNGVGATTIFSGTPRNYRIPGSPGILTTAHVHTKVAPPLSTTSTSSSSSSNDVYTIVRRFEFSSEKQRNVVVVSYPATKNSSSSNGSSSLHVHVKGSPEMIRKLCDPGSVPVDFDAELSKHTREGLRVLGLATRKLHSVSESAVQSLTQEELERGLCFVGFAVIVNPLREDTGAVLAELQAAGIRTVMVTGDHARTAVSVAHQCGMLQRGKSVVYFDTASSEGRVEDSTLSLTLTTAEGASVQGTHPTAILQGVATFHLDAAVTGRGFQRLGLDTEMEPSSGAASVGSSGLDLVLHRAGVFARMSPDDKRLLMELLGEGTVGADGEEAQGLGHHVGFCGDGANDVGALKSALVGVSLCEAEASVAAPLTSKRQTIACMVTVVAEGRCSLDTSYLIFKFIIVYAFVQVFAVNLMYSFGGSVGNYQYLIQDLLYTTVLAGTMGFTRPAKRLTGKRPPERLMSAGIWFPVIAQFVTCAAFQIVALGMLTSQPWYIRFDPGTDCFARSTANSPECSRSWENSALFVMSLGQFLITALVFNKGPPHRCGLWTNPLLLVAMLVQTLFLFYVLFSSGGVVAEVFAGMVVFPEGAFKRQLLGLLGVNLLVSAFVDQLAIWGWSALRGKTLFGTTLL